MAIPARTLKQEIDAIDCAILRLLGTEGRMPMTELGRQVGMSSPSVTERVRRLEDAGIIRGYRAELDPAALGLGISACIRVRPMPGQLEHVARLLANIEAVVECDRVTGDDCFVAKVHVASIQEIERIIDLIIPYAMTNTSVVQSSPVPRRLPQLPG
ncbi:Lrp/AsnC family transcriptional regulator [soil metagenome]